MSGDAVYIYVRRRDAAVRTLRHEVVHHEICASTLPYVQLLNRLLSEVNQEVYRRTERLTERLVGLLE